MPEAGAVRDAEARLLKLEEKVAYQDKLISELNDVVVKLSRDLDELRGRLHSAERTVRDELGARDMPNEKPAALLSARMTPRSVRAAKLAIVAVVVLGSRRRITSGSWGR